MTRVECVVVQLAGLSTDEDGNVRSRQLRLTEQTDLESRTGNRILLCDLVAHIASGHGFYYHTVGSWAPDAADRPEWLRGESPGATRESRRALAWVPPHAVIQAVNIFAPAALENVAA